MDPVCAYNLLPWEWIDKTINRSTYYVLHLQTLRFFLIRQNNECLLRNFHTTYLTMLINNLLPLSGR